MPTRPFSEIRSAGFAGDAKALGDVDLPRLGHLIGVGEDEIHAVVEVEATGDGFDSKKRPKMLFEPHVFYRNLSGSQRTRAVNAGLAYKDWRSGAYPKESYTRLFKAMEINETAALKAASWGLGQILGENFVAAGYDSPQKMVAAFVDGGEAEHLEAMIAFIRSNRLDDELRAHNWSGFARGYNGASYAKHGYHTKLASAFAKWRKIKDTPWKPGQDTPEPPLVEVEPVPPAADPERPTLQQGDQGKDVEALQRALCIKDDGLFGPKTDDAVRAFQSKNGLKADGLVGKKTWAALDREAGV